MGDGDWKPAFYALLILFVVGGLMTIILSGFVDTSTPNASNSFTNTSIYNVSIQYVNASFFDLITIPMNNSFASNSLFGVILGFPVQIFTDIFQFFSGQTITGFPIPIINVIALMGNDVKLFVIQQINTLTYIPLALLLPFMILFILGILWTGFRLFNPTAILP